MTQVRRVAAAMAGAGFLFAGSGEASGPPACAISAITLSPGPTGAMSIGTSLTLTATVSQTNCTTVVVDWQSSAPLIASVSTAGVVTALTAGGPVMITASSGGRQATVQVTVLSVPVASVTMSPAPLALYPGQTVQLAATTRDATDATLTGRLVTWTSSDEASATVSTLGVVTAVGPNATTRVTITATSEGKSAASSIVIAALHAKHFAFAFVSNPSAASYQMHGGDMASSAGWPGVVTRTGPGDYAISIPGLASTGGQTETVFVNAGAQSSNMCKVSSWSSSLATLVVNVRCFDPLGAPADTRFSVFVIGSESLDGRLGFAWADDPVAATYTPHAGYSFNSVAQPITITRSATGRYNVSFAGLGRGASGVQETVIVTAYGSSSETCKVVSWDAFSPALDVIVQCFDATGAAVDTRFDILVAEGGRSGRRFGLAFLDDPTATTYVPNSAYARSSSGLPISSTRAGVGTYSVTFGGLASVIGDGLENALVTAYGAGAARCALAGWGNASPTDMVVHVICYDTTGARVDSRFDLLLLE